MSPEDRSFSIAQAAHQTLDTALARSFDAQTHFAVATLQIMSVAAGGGIAAVLAFLTAHWDRLSTDPAAMANVTGVLFSMFASLVVSVLTGVMAYWCQSVYSRGIGAKDKVLDHPYVRDTRASSRLQRCGYYLELITIGFGLFALILLCVGAWHFYRIVGP